MFFVLLIAAAMLAIAAFIAAIIANSNSVTVTHKRYTNGEYIQYYYLLLQ